MKRAVYYLRLSKDDYSKGKKMSESDSIQNQRRLIDYYVEKNSGEYSKVDEYIDDGYTGLNFDRPDFQKMKADAKAKSFDVILVKDFSRFGRDENKVKTEADALVKSGIDIYACNEHLDWRKDSQKITSKINTMMNELYSQSISERIMATVLIKHKDGKFIGAFCSYGYKKDPMDKNRLIIDAEAAEIVKRIYKLYLEGYGKLSIAKILTKEKIPCPARYKEEHGLNYKNAHILNQTTEWQYSTVQKILTNQIYCGDMVQGKRNCSHFDKFENDRKKEDWIIVGNTHEPIISKPMFLEVQELLHKSGKNVYYNAPMNLFAGFLECGDCGKKMACVTNRYKGKITKTYLCNKYKMLGKDASNCSRHAIKEDELEEVIRKAINTEAKKYKKELEELKLRYDEKKNKEILKRKDTTELERKIEKLKKRQIIWTDNLADELITREEYIKDMLDIKNEMEDTERKIKEIKEQNENPRVDDQKRKLLESLIHENVQKLNRQLLNKYIKKIVVFENQKIKIEWNY